MEDFIQTVSAKEGELLYVLWGLLFIWFVIERNVVAIWIQKWFQKCFKSVDYDSMDEPELRIQIALAYGSIMLGIMTLPFAIMSPMAGDNPTYGMFWVGMTMFVFIFFPFYFLVWSGIVRLVRAKRAVQRLEKNK